MLSTLWAGRYRIGDSSGKPRFLLLIPIIIEVISKASEDVALLSQSEFRVLVVESAVLKDEAEIIPELLRLIVRPKFKCKINLMPLIINIS